MAKNRFEWTVKGNEFAEGGWKDTAAEAWTVAGQRAADHLRNDMDSAAIAVNNDIVAVTKATLRRVIAAKVKASK